MRGGSTGRGGTGLAGLGLRIVLGVVGCAGWLGCDGPGGGGGGVQDVVAPGDTNNSGDTLFGGSDAGDCSASTRRCNGQNVEECRNGAYVVLLQCPGTQVCEDAACVARTASPCDGKECGPNGSGGLCGVCEDNETCDGQGQCVAGCVPQCSNRECGNDGCGGTCGTCLPTESCDVSQLCVPTGCVPQCGGKECGTNGCGGQCGPGCAQGEQCVAGQCQGGQQCGCGTRECGEDACGNFCGACGDTETCDAGTCVGGGGGGISCTDLIGCIYDDGGCVSEATDEAFQLCAEGCFATASETGAAEFDAYLTCVSGCPETDGNPATTADDLAADRCFYDSCSDEQAACIFDAAGTGTCFGIFDCWDTCADTDDECIFACYEAATGPAQAALIGLNNCLSVECPDGSADTCIDTALAGPCGGFYNACAAN